MNTLSVVGLVPVTVVVVGSLVLAPVTVVVLVGSLKATLSLV